MKSRSVQLSLNESLDPSLFNPINELFVPSWKMKVIQELDDRGYFMRARKKPDMYGELELVHEYVKHDVLQDLAECKRNENHYWLNYDCGHDLLVEHSCKNKLCNNCMNALRWRHESIAGFIIGKMNKPRFMTISPKNYTEEQFRSGYAFDDLNKLWAAVRRQIDHEHASKKFKKRFFELTGNHIKSMKRMSSFVAVRELKFNKKGAPIMAAYRDVVTGKKKTFQLGSYCVNNWNVHLHIVFDGDFIPQKYVEYIVRQTSKDRSKVVDIKLIKDRFGFGWIKTANYLCKYLYKCDIPFDCIKQWADFYEISRWRRMVTYSHSIESEQVVIYRHSCLECGKGFLIGISRMGVFKGHRYFDFQEPTWMEKVSTEALEKYRRVMNYG